jgi:hypothetical protein
VLVVDEVSGMLGDNGGGIVRGGYRPGAGRKKQEVHNVRSQHQVRAFDDEWLLIKRFTSIVRANKGKAETLLAEAEKEA